MAERRGHQVGGRQVQVGLWGDHEGVLAAGLGEQHQIGIPAAEQVGRLVSTGQDDPVGGGHEVTTHLVLRGPDEPQHIGRHAGRPAGLGNDLGAAGRLGRGLEHHGVAGGQRGERAAGRNGHREIPRRDDGDHAQRGEPHPVDPLQFRCPLGVPAGEVDRLGDLRRRLGQGLGCLMCHGHQQVVVAGQQLVGHAAQHLPPPDTTEGLPPGLGRPGGDHHGVDAVRALHRRGHRRRRRFEGPACHHVDTRPHRKQRRIGVGLVPEGTLAGGPALSSLHPTALHLPAGQVADVPPVGHRPTEAVGLFGELRGAGAQREQVTQEVLVRSVLLQTTEQVGHRHVKVVTPHDRRVQQKATDLVSHRPGLSRRHALKHLELDPVGHPAGLGQQVGPRHVEQVVTGQTDAHRPTVDGPQRPVDAALVVGVNLGLAVVRRLDPAVHGGVDAFHGQVGPFHQPDLHLAPSGIVTGRGP